jgi:hypothetical protein
MADVEAVLLDLLRLPDGRDGVALPDLTEGDWQQLLRETPRPLRPWLDYCVGRRLAPGQVPAAVLAELSEVRRGAAVGHLRRRAVLRNLLPALERGGVTSVVLKGAALASLCYPEPALRPMGDFDLWVAEEDLDRAVDAARTAGLDYSPRLRDRVSAAKELHRATTRVLECSRSGVVLELHGVVGSLLGMSAAWHERARHRAEKRQLDGIEGWVMHPEDMLTHLAVHCGRKDRFRAGAQPLLDIALWTRAEAGRIDWTALAEDWQRERVATWCVLVVGLARDLFGAPVPATLVPRMEASSDFARLRELARRQVMGSLLTLPKAMAHLVSMPLPERAAWLLNRMTVWYWKGPPGVSRTARQVLGDAGRRMGHDIRHKLAPYFRGFATGQFLGRSFRRRRDIALGRQRLAELVERAESRYSSQPPT